MPREFTADWHTWHTPNWLQWLGPMKGRPNLRCLEIGSHEGRSACWLLENVLTGPGCQLICVDPWWDAAAERRFDRNTQDTGKRHKLTKWKGLSRHRLPGMPERSLDFAYIDGSHEARDALLDGLLVLPLMKARGLMLFDDYEWQETRAEPIRVQPPKPGIDAFLRLAADRVELVAKGWQVLCRVQ